MLRKLEISPRHAGILVFPERFFIGGSAPMKPTRKNLSLTPNLALKTRKFEYLSQSKIRFSTSGKRITLELKRYLGISSDIMVLRSLQAAFKACSVVMGSTGFPRT